LKKLSEELLRDAFMREKDADDYVTLAPKGMDASLFDKFLRVLEAKKPSDVADVTDEELVEMLAQGKKLFSYMDFDDSFNADMREELSAIRNTSKCHYRRRVL